VVGLHQTLGWTCFICFGAFFSSALMHEQSPRTKGLRTASPLQPAGAACMPVVCGHVGKPINKNLILSPFLNMTF
jgi:hypothetical protein